MILAEAKKYHAYARECLKLAEGATRPDVGEQLIELSRVWMQAALAGEQYHLEGTVRKAGPESTYADPSVSAK